MATNLSDPGELLEFGRRSGIDGDVVPTSSLNMLLPGQAVTLYSEPQLRRLAAGMREPGKVVYGPASTETVAKLARRRPFAVVRR